MKKILLIFLFSLLSISTFGQRIRFSDSSNIWNYTYFSSGIMPPFFWQFSDYYSGDTIIRGINYKQLWHACDMDFAFIREDTLLHKVFAILPVYGTDTAEKLLYDYTLNVGDTFRTIYDRYYVYNIDSVLVGAMWYKVWKLRHYGSPDYYLSYIEGIGSISDPVDNITPIPSTIEGGNTLMCFQNNGSVPPISPALGPYAWDGSSSFFYFNNTSSCNYPFSLNTINPINLTTTISPNPAQNEISIQVSDIITSLSIYDLVGHVLYSRTCNSQKETINIEDIPAGMYLIKINGTDVRKFVKQ